MGVAWGLVEYPTDWFEGREEVIGEWSSFARKALSGHHVFNIMHGEERINFCWAGGANGNVELLVTAWKDSLTRTRIDALDKSEGTYDMFDRLIEGYDLFVPWAVKSLRLEMSGGSLYVGELDYLIAITRDAPELEDYADDPHIITLAKNLCAAGRLAKELKMLIQIAY